ncbi:unnamed protein product [Dibothriocephalus latus]|uniref:Uncharacterized protein n=1 Tax=Dibothriocephalus latus TaxID=60516 RepID=A0A3P7LAQ2_DIBLA|nr:unnamed protein product [Dibothriocephalus latus]
MLTSISPFQAPSMSDIPGFRTPSARSASSSNGTTHGITSLPEHASNSSGDSSKHALRREYSAPTITATASSACKIEARTSVTPPTPAPTVTCPQTGLRYPAPFSDEPAAVKALNECDYSIRITMEMAKSGTCTNPSSVPFLKLQRLVVARLS